MIDFYMLTVIIRPSIHEFSITYRNDLSEIEL